MYKAYDKGIILNYDLVKQTKWQNIVLNKTQYILEH